MDDKTKSRVGIFISDIPLSVFKRFKLPCQERCGDTYWVRLKELLDIEERYQKLSSKQEESHNKLSKTEDKKDE